MTTTVTTVTTERAASRARAVKKAVRRAGTRARYGSDQVWRHVLNAGAVRAFRASPPRLGPEARRVLRDLREQGFAVTDLETLTSDPTLLGRLVAHSTELEAVKAARPGNGEFDKPFLIELLEGEQPELAPDDLLLEVATHPELKGVADHYFGLLTRVANVNIWRNIRIGTAPSSSQLWHRDLVEDRIVLKAYVYLEDVPLGAGPFSYAAGTQPGGPRDADLPTYFDGMNDRVSEEVAAAHLAEHEHVLAGPRGTVVIANTLGYHRGGYATEADRFVLQVRYASRAASRSLRLTPPPGVDPRPHRDAIAYGPPRS